MEILNKNWYVNEKHRFIFSMHSRQNHFQSFCLLINFIGEYIHWIQKIHCCTSLFVPRFLFLLPKYSMHVYDIYGYFKYKFNIENTFWKIYEPINTYKISSDADFSIILIHNKYNFSMNSTIWIIFFWDIFPMGGGFLFHSVLFYKIT